LSVTSKLPVGQIESAATDIPPSSFAGSSSAPAQGFYPVTQIFEHAATDEALRVPIADAAATGDPR
jgi:hypothetical protein